MPRTSGAMLVVCVGLAALVAGAAAGQPVAPAPRTPWDVIRTSPVHTILKTLIEANNLVSAVDKTGIIVMAPTNDQLQPVIDRGVPATAPWVVQVVAHHVITVSSLNSGNLPTLNGNIVNKGSSSHPDLFDGQGKAFWAELLANTWATHPTGGALVYRPSIVLHPANAFPSLAAAATTAGLTTLADLVVKQGLLDALEAPATQKTVFGPTNAAFTAISSVVAGLSSAQVTSVLQYHVTPRIATVPFTSGVISTLLSGQSLELVAPRSIKDTTAVLAVVAVENVYYPGGVVQVIGKVLIPSLGTPAPAPTPAPVPSPVPEPAPVPTPVPTSPKTPWDVIRGSPRHTILKALIEANNLVSAVDKTGIIVMAPTDDQLKPVVDAGVPATAPWVVQVVAHHVITVSSLSSGNLPTLNGNIVNKGSGSHPDLADGQGKSFWAELLANTWATHPTGGALVYRPSIVLHPANAFPSLAGAASAAGLNTLTDLVVKQGLLPVLERPAVQKTVLAPTDAAFSAISSTLAGLSSTQVFSVLEYHVGQVLVTVPFTSGALPTRLMGQSLQLVAPGTIRDTTTTPAHVLVSNVFYPGGVIHTIGKVLIPNLTASG